MAEKIKKKDQKKCGVCGDVALGSNFNAITCESCKAFFRRNALKTKEFKCPFDNNCKVDMITRRFCQKCRLKKCFAIGMKKEWILSDEEKKAKREKIEKNRKKRTVHEMQEITCIKTEIEVTEDSESIMSPIPAMSPLTPQTPGSVGISADLPKTHVIIHQPLTPSDCEYSPPAKMLHLEGTSDSIHHEKISEASLQHDRNLLSETESLSSDAINASSYSPDAIFSTKSSSEEQVKTLLVPRSKTSSSCPISEAAYAKAMEIEFIELPIRTSLMNSKELNSIEREKLDELISANEVLKMPLNCGINDPCLLDVLNMTSYAIRRLIKMSKKLTAFKSLCQEDQIALLKGGCTELMILRSVMSYDPEKDCWQGPSGPKEMSIKVEVLKEAKGNLYEEHKRFITSFHRHWRVDENIMLILCGIVLFNPERPNTVHKEAIKFEQDTYYYLLRRYLDSVHGWCESKPMYIALIQKIQELHILNDNHVRVYLDLNPKEVEPLLIEIFDLKH